MMEVSIQANVSFLIADFVARSVPDNLANARDRFERLPVTPQNSAGFGGSTALHAGDKRRVRYSPHQSVFGIVDPLQNLFRRVALREGSIQLTSKAGVADEPTLIMGDPSAGFQKRVTRKMSVKDLLLSYIPAGTVAPANAQLVREISETMIPEQKRILPASYRLLEPTTGHFHMRGRVVKVIKVVAEKNCRHPRVVRTNTLDHSDLVVNVGNDQTGLVVVVHAFIRKENSPAKLLRPVFMGSRAAYRIAWPIPSRFPSLSLNHAAFSPTPPRLG